MGNRASLVDVIELLDQPLPDDALLPLPEPLEFSDVVQFDDVRFRYGDEGPWVLDGLNVRILKGARIGFVGPTGSRKSTAIDLLMGLLSSSEGAFLVDGQPVEGQRIKA